MSCDYCYDLGKVVFEFYRKDLCSGGFDMMDFETAPCPMCPHLL